MARISARVVGALLIRLGAALLTRHRPRPSPPVVPGREAARGRDHTADPVLPGAAFTAESGFSAARRLRRRLEESRWIALRPKTTEEARRRTPRTGRSSDEGEEEPR
jgi:hypothetical protein